MNIVNREYAKELWAKDITWECGLCKAGFAWVPAGKSAYRIKEDGHDRGGAYLSPSDHVFDHAPYVVTLADGKEYGFCSQECVRTKAMMVGLEKIVRPAETPSREHSPILCLSCMNSKCPYPYSRGQATSCPEHKTNHGPAFDSPFYTKPGHPKKATGVVIEGIEAKQYCVLRDAQIHDGKCIQCAEIRRAITSIALKVRNGDPGIKFEE